MKVVIIWWFLSPRIISLGLEKSGFLGDPGEYQHNLDLLDNSKVDISKRLLLTK